MTGHRPLVNILHRHGSALFTPHFDPARDGYDVVENGDTATAWDLLVVFEAMPGAATYKVREGATVFIGGEPPAIGQHSRRFLSQFDSVFCAGAAASRSARLSSRQHFNNWHFGYSARQAAYRHDHRTIRDMPPPQKTLSLSTVTSNLNYLPMHIQRRALVDRLARDYAGRIDFFGRPHNFVEYEEDAILPYRFHLCIENCREPDLWTEKIADALLGYAVPVYAGCPNIDDYFPGATIALDLDNYAETRRTIDAILTNGEALYESRIQAVVAARQRLIEEFDISALIASQLRLAGHQDMREIALVPEDQFPMARARDLFHRAQRKLTTLVWRRKVARNGA